MSTITSTRHPLQTLGMASSNQRPRRRSARLAFGDDDDEPRATDGAGKDVGNKRAKTTGTGGRMAVGKGKSASYEEEDDGFTFTRTKAKKPKAPAQEARHQPVVVEEREQTPVKAKPSRRHKTFDTPVASEKVDKPRRRSGRSSHDDHEDMKEAPKAMRKAEQDSRPRSRGDSTVELVERHQKPRSEETKIALPFSDTPVINRNKAMRTARASGVGNRRSSIGLRGRRASSLIENGSIAMPHKTVEASEFYKHIASDGLTEPRRMKQLLTWCATRAMGEKPGYSSGVEGSARSAARHIQEELLNDIANRSEMSDWFDREEVQPPPPLVKKPNPRNIANIQKAQELEKRIEAIRAQKALYNTLLPPPPPNPQTVTSLHPSKLRTSNLPADQQPLLSTLSSLAPLPPEINQRLASLSSSLELKVDTFAHRIHTLETWRGQAERVADKVLAGVAEKLEDREKRTLEKAGMSAVDGKEILKALAGVVSGNGVG